jgi:hypothetical protein
LKNLLKIFFGGSRKQQSPLVSIVLLFFGGNVSMAVIWPGLEAEGREAG